jgi:hypothetical protein
MARNKPSSNARALQNRRREIRANLANINEFNSNPQRNCPLFSKLPVEVRLKIFDLALSEHEDSSLPMPAGSMFYRPRHFFKTRIFTNLLRTCRMIYAEASHIPMASATHTLSAREAFPGRVPHFNSWTAKNLSEFGNLQLFGRPEIWTKKLRNLPPLDPKVITITTRFVDWDVGFNPLESCVPDEWKRQLCSVITHRTALAENVPNPTQSTGVLHIKGTGRLQEVRIEFEAYVSQEQQLRNFAAGVIQQELDKTVDSCTLSISVSRGGGMKPILTLDPNRVTIEKWNSPYNIFTMDGSTGVVRWIPGRYIVVTFVFTECCHCADCEPSSKQQICKRRLKRATAAENAIVDITPRSWYTESLDIETNDKSWKSFWDLAKTFS